MPAVSNVFRNWTYLFASDVFTQLLGFMSMVTLARKLSVEGYGQYNLVIAVSSMFVVLANGGMSQVIIREISQNRSKARDLIKKIIVCRSVTYSLTVIGIFIYWQTTKNSISYEIMVMAALFALLLSTWDACESVAFGHEIMKYSALLTTAFQVVWVSALVFLPTSILTINIVLIVANIISAIKIFIYIFLLKRNVAFSESKDAKTALTAIIAMSFPYLWLWGASTLSNQIPVLLLSNQSGVKEVALYSVGMRLVIPLTLSINTAMRAVFPTFSRMSLEQPHLLREKIAEATRFIMIVGSAIAFLLTILSQYFIPALFGAKYVPAVSSFNFLVWFGIIYSLDIVLGTTLSAFNKQNVLAKLATLDLLIALPICYMGSKYGSEGMAFSRLIFGVIVLLYHWFVIKKVVNVSIEVIEWLQMLTYFSTAVLISILSFSVLMKIIIFMSVAIAISFLPKNPINKAVKFTALIAKKVVTF